MDLTSAALKRGWASFDSGSAPFESTGDILFARPLFGEDDIVVTVVVAVGGRSWEAREIAAPDVGGSLPVNSSLFIRDLRSSNSSQTVEGAVVDTLDSVPSVARCVTGAS